MLVVLNKTIWNVVLLQDCQGDSGESSKDHKPAESQSVEARGTCAFLSKSDSNATCTGSLRAFILKHHSGTNSACPKVLLLLT